MENQDFIPGEVIDNSQQEQTQPPSESERELYTKAGQEEKVSNFLTQTSPVSALDRINYTLQGYAFDSVKKEWTKVSKGIPEKMRKDILQFLTPDLSEDVRMTRLDEKQINGIMEATIDFIQYYLYNTDDSWSIKNLDRIFWIVVKTVFYTITRSLNGVERDRIYRSLNLGGQIGEMNGENKQNKEWWKFWK